MAGRVSSSHACALSLSSRSARRLKPRTLRPLPPFRYDRSVDAADEGDLRWQQVTPAGVLLVSTDAALRVSISSAARSPGRSPSSAGCRPTASAWSRVAPHGSGAPGSAAGLRPGDRRGRLRFAAPEPHPGGHPRVLPRAAPSCARAARGRAAGRGALRPRAGDQRWASESLFQTEPRSGGLVASCRAWRVPLPKAPRWRSSRRVPDMIVVETLLGLRGLTRGRVPCGGRRPCPRRGATQPDMCGSTRRSTNPIAFT